ncbi:hypothetical protein AB0I15_54515, partial [Nonomuraea sp. NPDC050643]
MLLLLAVLGVCSPALPAQADETAGRVAFIGVTGLLWADLNARDTPRMWELAGRSGIGSVSVKAVGTVTCPYDGWLTVASGVRSAVGRRCGLPPEPMSSRRCWTRRLREGSRRGWTGSRRGSCPRSST